MHQHRSRRPARGRLPALARSLLYLALGLAGPARAVGFAPLAIPADGAEPAIQAMVWSPCRAPSAPVPMGPYIVQGTPDCAVAGEALPLVVISHGNGGSLRGHHDTAEALADAGFVVVTLNHPGNSYGDNGREADFQVFESRPRDVSRVITFMLQRWPERQHLAPDDVGVFGFSRGGYTALAIAGARPSPAAAAHNLCAPWWSVFSRLCRALDDGDTTLAPQADPRVRAVVAVDPLSLFDAVGLQSVHVPVQLWMSERGGDGVQPATVEAIHAALPAAEFHVAPNAGHFAYLAPCPPAMQAENADICTDPPGFDRVAWHQAMNAEVVRFFRQHLGPPGPG